MAHHNMENINSHFGGEVEAVHDSSFVYLMSKEQSFDDIYTLVKLHHRTRKPPTNWQPSQGR